MTGAHDAITASPEYSRAYYHYTEHGADPEEAARLAYTYVQAQQPIGVTDKEVRIQLLDAAVRRAVGFRWTVENRSDFQAVLTHEVPVNHVLHMLLTLFTFGLWAPVWIYLAARASQQRCTVSVAANGEVTWSTPVNY